MTLREFIVEASNVKEELKDTNIVIEAPNGLFLTPKIRFKLKEKGVMSIDKKNVEKIVLHWD